MCRRHGRRDAGRMNVIEVHDIVKRVRRPRGRRRCLVRRRGRRDLRHPRPERCRQDHHRRVHRRPADPRLGHDQGPGPRPTTTTAPPCANSVGVQLQESHLPDQLRVWEALDLYASFYEQPADWERLIDDLGLATQRKTAFGKLSGGQKQRLSIALALVGNPTHRHPRRADDRARPAGAARHLGPDRRRPRPRRDRRPGDPFHGGGRAARRSDRRHRRREGRRPRHADGHRQSGRRGAATALPTVGRRSTNRSSPGCPKSAA